VSTKDYIIGRQKFVNEVSGVLRGRPAALLFSNNPGTISNGYFVPDGVEFEDFIIVSEHNRDAIQMKANRIEQRKRTINGKMRSYHIADKLSLSVSWNMLPSRSFNSSPVFNESGTLSGTDEVTVDGGAGGAELLNWYENHYGSFYVYLAYDKYTEFNPNSTNQYGHLHEYNQVLEMFIADFSYSIVKRGANEHDLWNVSITLEEA
jgi:hypothetical protein